MGVSVRVGLCLLLILLASGCRRTPGGTPPPDFPQHVTFRMWGKVEKVEAVESRLKDGVVALMSATVRVSKVEGNENGEPVRPGDAVRVQWMRMVKRPAAPTPGFDPIDHDIKEGDEGAFRVEGYGRPFALVKRQDAFERSR
jgi:hypothetical protein